MEEKPPTDIIESLKAFAEQKEIPFDEVKTRFKEIYDTDEIAQTIEDHEQRCMYAHGQLLAIMTTAGGQNVIIRVASKFYPREWKTTEGEKRKVSDMYGALFTFGEEGNVNPDPEFGAVALWGDAADLVNDVEEGELYQVQLVKTNKQPEWGATYQTGRDDTRFEKIDSKLLTNDEYYEKYIKPLDIDIDLNQIDMYISESNTDLRRVTGTVVRVDKGNNAKTGRPYGLFHIIDKTTTEQFTIWCSQRFITNGIGSLITATGNIAKSKKDDSVFMNAYFVRMKKEIQKAKKLKNLMFMNFRKCVYGKSERK